MKYGRLIKDVYTNVSDVIDYTQYGRRPTPAVSMNTFSVHGANASRMHAFPASRTRGSNVTRQRTDAGGSGGGGGGGGVGGGGPRKNAVAGFIGHAPYGSAEQQMLKRLMSRWDIKKI